MKNLCHKSNFFCTLLNIPALSALGNKAFEVLKDQIVVTDPVTTKLNERFGELETSKTFNHPAVGVLDCRKSLKDYRLLKKHVNSTFKIQNPLRLAGCWLA